MTVATPTAAPTSSVSCACKIFRAFNSDPPAKDGSAEDAAGLGAPLGAVLAGFLHEGLEQAVILADLRVPEHAEREAPVGIFQRLERPVVRMRRLAEPLAELPESLVVVRLHGS